MFRSQPPTLPQSTRARVYFSCPQSPAECPIGNSSPRFIRVSTWNVPSTSRLAEGLSIPIVAIIQPFAELNDQEEPIPVIQCGDSGPARCEKCGAYVNPWCTWTAGGIRWKCNLCAHETRGELAERRIPSLNLLQHMEVEPNYFSSLDANLARLDYSERPELQKGTVDFDVSQLADYWASNPSQYSGLSTTLSNPILNDAARRPKNMRYIFVLEVSDASVRSGFLAAACVALRAILHGRIAEDGSEAAQACLPSGCSIALVTFDDTLHFYDLSVCTRSWSRWCFGTNSSLQPNQASPKHLVVPDIDEPFLPLPASALFVDPHQSRCANFLYYLESS